MGSETLPDRSNGQIINEAWFDIIRSAADGNWVPRINGSALDVGGDLGTATLRWKRAHIRTGYWDIGDIKMRHSMGGALAVGHGWMLCDGRQVTVAAYETEHGAGTWATYIGSTAMSGLYLPNLTGTAFVAGVAATSEPGTASAPAQIGANTISLTHSHGVAAHSHVWYSTGQGATDGSLASANTDIAVGPVSISAPRLTGDRTTATTGLQTSAVLSAAQTIVSKAVEGLYYMRVI